MFNLANKLLNKCNHSCLGSKCTLKKYLPHKCSVSSIIAKEIKLILKYLVIYLQLAKEFPSYFTGDNGLGDGQCSGLLKLGRNSDHSIWR